MDLKNKNLESLIKNKLDSYEMEYNHSDWVRLEKDLPAANSALTDNKAVSFGKIAAVVGITILAVIGTIYIFNSNEKNIRMKAERNITEKKSVSIDNTIKESVNTNVGKNKNCSSDKLINVCSNVITNSENNKIQNSQSNSDNNSVAIDKNQFLQKDIYSVGSNFSDKNENDVINVTPAINTNILAPDASFTIDITEGCTPLKVTFTPNLICDSAQYIWTFSDGETSNAMKPVHVYDEEISAIPSLTIKYPKSKVSGSSSLSRSIVVKPSPRANFNWDSSDNTFSFNNRSGNVVKAKWAFGNGEESTDENPKYSYKISGKYIVSLTVISLNGCSDIASKDLKVQIKHNIIFPTGFIPNAGGPNGFFSPTGDDLSEIQYSIAIYSRNGQLVFESNDVNEKWNGKVKGSDQLCEPGVYGYQVFIKDKYGNLEKKVGNVTILVK